MATRAGQAIATDSRGELVSTSSGLTYVRRIDINIPVSVYDPKTKRVEIRNFRIRGTLHL